MKISNLGMIVAAGGAGKRFSVNQNKLLAEFHGQPVLLHTLKHFLLRLKPGMLIVVAPENMLELMRSLCDEAFRPITSSGVAADRLELLLYITVFAHFGNNRNGSPSMTRRARWRMPNYCSNCLMPHGNAVAPFPATRRSIRSRSLIQKDSSPPIWRVLRCF